MKRTSFRWGMLGLVLFGVGGGILLLWLQPDTTVAADDNDIAAFLARHWRVPIAPQGTPPPAYSPLEASLHPKDCGVCHPSQYQDWQTSLHSKSMGPGIYGQLVDMESDPATYTICATCHTPLQEQIPFAAEGNTYRPNPRFDKQLQHAGLVCAACHVRQHKRFGPPRRPEAPVPPEGTVLPHGGFTVSTAFQQSAFCKSCHQFGPNDFALNGKLLENTYEEWRQSSYAKEGTQCQNCHMPDRRHLWRGIHDPDMVKQAMTITIKPNASTYQPGDQLQAVITVANTGAGHYLPTYVTPKIFVNAHLLDAQGDAINGTAQQAIIGRDITLDLSEELYDTRIPPNDSRAFTYAQVVPNVAVALHVRVVVHPDHFYRNFYEAVLSNGGNSRGTAILEQALEHATSSPFPVFDQTIPLTDTAG